MSRMKVGVPVFVDVRDDAPEILKKFGCAISVPERDGVFWCVFLSILLQIRDDEEKMKEFVRATNGKGDRKMSPAKIKRRLVNFNPFLNRYELFNEPEMVRSIDIFVTSAFEYRNTYIDALTFDSKSDIDALLWPKIEIWFDVLSNMMNCKIYYFLEKYSLVSVFPKYVVDRSTTERNLDVLVFVSSAERAFGMCRRTAEKMQKSAIEKILPEIKFLPEDRNSNFLARLLKEGDASSIDLVLRKPNYILDEIREAGFPTDVIEKNPRPTTFFERCLNLMRGRNRSSFYEKIAGSGRPDWLFALYDYSLSKTYEDDDATSEEMTVLTTTDLLKTSIGGNLTTLVRCVSSRDLTVVRRYKETDASLQKLLNFNLFLSEVMRLTKDRERGDPGLIMLIVDMFLSLEEEDAAIDYACCLLISDLYQLCDNQAGVRTRELSLIGRTFSARTCDEIALSRFGSEVLAVADDCDFFKKRTLLLRANQVILSKKWARRAIGEGCVEDLRFLSRVFCGAEYARTRVIFEKDKNLFELLSRELKNVFSWCLTTPRDGRFDFSEDFKTKIQEARCSAGATRRRNLEFFETSVEMLKDVLVNDNDRFKMLWDDAKTRANVDDLIRQLERFYVDDAVVRSCVEFLLSDCLAMINDSCGFDHRPPAVLARLRLISRSFDNPFNSFNLQALFSHREPHHASVIRSVGKIMAPYRVSNAAIDVAMRLVRDLEVVSTINRMKVDVGNDYRILRRCILTDDDEEDFAKSCRLIKRCSDWDHYLHMLKTD